MDRIDIYSYIVDNLYNTYVDKNNDYGNSVGDTYEEFGPVSFVVRIADKFNRIKSLTKGTEQKVMDESLHDTILDMANYCLLWLVEEDYRKQMEADAESVTKINASGLKIEDSTGTFNFTYTPNCDCEFKLGIANAIVNPYESVPYKGLYIQDVDSWHYVYKFVSNNAPVIPYTVEQSRADAIEYIDNIVAEVSK